VLGTIKKGLPMTSVKDLLPCAHCGGEADQVLHSGYGVCLYRIECKKCPIRTMDTFLDNKDNLIAAWNSRVAEKEVAK
jgi:hypothetical protein